MSTPCPECGTPSDEVPFAACVTHAKDRSDEPQGTANVWYRGWECGYEPERGNWVKDAWVGYKGGADIDVPTVSSETWVGLLDEIDDQEDE